MLEREVLSLFFPSLFYFFWYRKPCHMGAVLTKPCKFLSASGRDVRQRWHLAYNVQPHNSVKMSPNDHLYCGNLFSDRVLSSKF